MVCSLARRSVFVALLGAALTASRGAQAQTQGARATGIFFRAGAVVSGFGLASMTFRLQDRSSARGAAPSFTGKQLALGREWLGGASLSAHVDGPWFYVRVGAELYASPSPGMEEFRIESTALGWIAAGPRFSFGSFALLAGLRAGALLVDLTHFERRPDGSGERTFRREYTGLGALYAVDVGAQWRPLRWLQVDVMVGQDVLGAMLATTAALHVNFGWSAAR